MDKNSDEINITKNENGIEETLHYIYDYVCLTNHRVSINNEDILTVDKRSQTQINIILNYGEECVVKFNNEENLDKWLKKNIYTGKDELKMLKEKIENLENGYHKLYDKIEKLGEAIGLIPGGIEYKNVKED